MKIRVAHQFGYGGRDVAKAMTDDRAGITIITIAWFSLRLKPAFAGFFTGGSYRRLSGGARPVTSECALPWPGAFSWLTGAYPLCDTCLSFMQWWSGNNAQSKQCIQMVVHYWRQQGAVCVRDSMTGLVLVEPVVTLMPVVIQLIRTLMVVRHRSIYSSCQGCY